MKNIQIFGAIALTVALAGFTLALRAAEEGIKEGKATIRSVHGSAEYMENGAWLPLHPNMKFKPGVSLRTGADGTVDLSVNGNSSAIRLTNNTVLRIPTMSYVGSMREGDNTTMLDLRTGSIIGNVKKISANSRYEIMTPHGVAGVRGTDLQVSAIPQGDGSFSVTFKSITGIITASAVVNSVTVTHTLTSGMSWTVGESPTTIPVQELQVLQFEALNLAQFVSSFFGGIPGVPVNRGGPSFVPPFVGPPQGPPSS